MVEAGARWVQDFELGRLKISPHQKQSQNFGSGSTRYNRKRTALRSKLAVQYRTASHQKRVAQQAFNEIWSKPINYALETIDAAGTLNLLFKTPDSQRSRRVCFHRPSDYGSRDQWANAGNAHEALARMGKVTAL
jgi:hypothetical protein